MHRWILGVLLGLVVIGGGVAGCGGGGEDEASANVTKAQFTREANAICAERKGKWDAQVKASKKELAAEGGSLNEEVADRLVSSSLVPLMQEEQEKLEALSAPQGEEEAVSKMMETRSIAIEKIEDGGVAAVYKPSTLSPFYEQASKYGLKCQL